MSSPRPTWPSLYNPLLEIAHIPHRPPISPGAAYLDDTKDVYRFTLYWTLVLYTPLFVLCGLFAFLNIILAPARHADTGHIYYPLSLRPPAAKPPPSVRISPPRPNPNRTRVTYACIVLFTFCAAGVLGAVVGSAVVGYVLAGLFKAARFHMSTWIPFLFALIQTLLGLLGVWPSVIEII